MSPSTREEPHPSPAWHPAGWRLRTRLIVLLMLFLGLACLAIGLVSYGAMNATLKGQLHGQLSEASHRATSFSGTRPGQGTGANAGTPPNPLNAPGQAAGTLNARFSTQGFLSGGILDSGGEIQNLTSEDQSTLRAIRPGEEKDVDLTSGDYLVVAETDPSGQIVVTGLPLKGVHHTLKSLVAIMAGVSGTSLVLAGIMGSAAIRRTMKPLERVSAVATSVSRLDLESGQLPAASRVSPRDARSDTEVGAVGHAFNQMLDNVGSALTARQKSEDHMREFVGNASHELRTPLASIRGYSDLLKWTENFTDEGRTSLERIDSQSQRMAALVDDLLLLARLDEGREPAWETVDLTDLVVENVADIQVAAPLHEWRLELPAEPITLRADPRQVQQILLNLLSNARKHTEEGTRVTTALSPSANGHDAVLTVTDNGPGIDPNFQDKIFGRFARADQARSGGEGTTGLGLAIVKALVEAHGGTIGLTSRPGHTEFEVRLPLASSVE